MRLIDSHPELWKRAVAFPAGLKMIEIPGENLPTLLVKLPIQYILTARMNSGFQLYIVPIEIQGNSTVGIISAFFEDEDSPLFNWTPLSLDEYSRTFLLKLLNNQLIVRMLDEHGRELIAYIANTIVPEVSRTRIEKAKLITADHELNHAMFEYAEHWFCLRNQVEDMNAIRLEFHSALYPDDLNYKDDRFELFNFQGSKGFANVSLVRSEPGQFQEIDIILLLQKIFRPEQIFHAPLRTYDKEEICDVLVITGDICLIVHAKDSPNTELMLNNKLGRKRAKALSQLENGCKQVSGTIGYFERIQPLEFILNGQLTTMEVGAKSILSLVVVRELFENDYQIYSNKLMNHFNKIQLPCLAVSYGELIQWCNFCNGDKGFEKAYIQVFNDGIETGIFKKLRFGIRDLYDEDGEFRF